MQKVSFYKDWSRCNEEHIHWVKNVQWEKVDLPDDFVLNLPRTKDAVGGARVGYFQDGFATYQKEFDAPSDWQGKTVLLNIDGAYMNAQVNCNGENLRLHPLCSGSDPLPAV